MNFLIYILAFAVSTIAQICPPEHFSAVITISTDDVIEDPENINLNDPDLTFFKTVLKFRDSDIQHTIDDAIQFFNNTFGLDFSDSPNEKNERFFQNAMMRPYILAPDIDNFIIDSHWIRSGNSYSSCYRLRNGGFQATFSAEQTLYGSYGGAEGKTVGIGNYVDYGFYIADVCKQSPLIIQFQSRSPARVEPIDGSLVVPIDLYNQVLGYGTATALVQLYPDPNEPGKFRAMNRNVMVFYSN